jgi:hypothetical protein
MDINTFFPYGNRWFYPVFLVWFLATAIFFTSLPMMLSATAQHYFLEIGMPIDTSPDGFGTAALLYGIGRVMFQATAMFVMASELLDGYHEYKARKLEGDTL